MLLRSIIVNGEECQIDYLSLANLPTLDGGGEGGNLDLEIEYNVIEGSRNPVTSGAVYEEIQNVYDAITTESDSRVQSIEQLTSQLGEKVDIVDGKGLSSNDFTTAYKNILDRETDGLLKVASRADEGKIPWIHNGHWEYATLDSIVPYAENGSF